MNSDRDLILQVQAGEPAAQEELVRRHSPRVFRLVGRFFRTREDVEDLAQEVFLRVFRRIDQVRPDENFGGWLTAVATNLCYDELRKRKRRNQALEGSDGLVEPGVRPEAETMVKVRSAVETLDPKLRIPLILKEVEGDSVEEIAQYLGITQTNVKVRLFRARRKLAALLRA